MDQRSNGDGNSQPSPPPSHQNKTEQLESQYYHSTPMAATGSHRRQAQTFSDHRSSPAMSLRSKRKHRRHGSMDGILRRGGFRFPRAADLQEELDEDYDDDADVRDAMSPKVDAMDVREIVRNRKQEPGGRISNKEALTQFIVKNFRNAQCKTYVYDAHERNGDCVCGRQIDWHQENIGPDALDQLVDSNYEWTPKNDTALIPPESFGEIEFAGSMADDQSRLVPYLRVHDSAADAPELIWTLLHKYWRLTPPKLIISVTGGAKKFHLKPRMLNKIKRGLTNAARSTGAWIISGGTGAGVMKLVGEAIQEHTSTMGNSYENRIVCLGIAAWGIVENKSFLTGEPGRGLFPARYSFDSEKLRTEDVSKLQIHSKGVALLDRHHTHFLLVDNGTEFKYGAEVDFRAKLESHLSSRVQKVGAESVNVPLVQIVIEGGPNTLKTVACSLRNQTPVVVIDGSGRAADLIAFVLKKIERRVPTGESSRVQSAVPMSKKLEEEVLEKADKLLSISSAYRRDPSSWNQRKMNNIKEEVLEYLQIIVSEAQLVSVVRFDQMGLRHVDELDKAIFDALLKSKKSDCRTQLNLALALNLPDIARDKIFKLENRQKWHRMNLFQAMQSALINDQVDFVQLFLDSGFDLKRFLTVKRLRTLYHEVMRDNLSSTSCGEMLQRLLADADVAVCSCMCCCCASTASAELAIDEVRDSPALLRHIGQVIVYLLDGQYANPYDDEKYEDKPTILEQFGSTVPMRHQMVSGLSDTAGTANGQPASSGGRRSSLARNSSADCGQTFVSQTSGVNTLRSNQAVDLYDFLLPERELFYWAVLCNRRELAYLFWRTGKDHIGGALLAAAMLKRMNNTASSDEEMDLAQDLLKHSELFERRALGVLGVCYGRDRFLAHRLLTRELTTWGNTTLFTVADSAELMLFTEHPLKKWRQVKAADCRCCQTRLSEIWTGNMVQYTSLWKVFLNLLTLGACSWLIRFVRRQEQPQSGSIRKHRVGNLEQSNTDNGTQGSSDGSQKAAGQKKRVRFTVNVWSDAGPTQIGFHKAWYFFMTAPVTKFVGSLLSYVVFLLLFSYFLLTDLKPMDQGGPSVVECIVWLWAVTLMVEEFRQVATKGAQSLRYKCDVWVQNVWNKFDLFIYLMISLCIVLRFAVHNFIIEGTVHFDELPAENESLVAVENNVSNFSSAEKLETISENFSIVHTFYSITLVACFLRFLHMFFVHKNIGPKVIMIRGMLTDIMFFLVILVVFLLGFGVAINSLLYPNMSMSFQLLKQVILRPYWQMYGELFLLEVDYGVIEEWDCTDNKTLAEMYPYEQRLCPRHSTVAVFLLAIYMILTNVLLLNLLIAMFSYTFQSVQDKSEQVWKFYRLSLIQEYHDRPTLPAPFILITHIYRLFRYAVNKCRKRNPAVGDGFCFPSIFRPVNLFHRRLSPEDDGRLSKFEAAGMENYLLHSQWEDREKFQTKLSGTFDSYKDEAAEINVKALEKIQDELEILKEHLLASYERGLYDTGSSHQPTQSISMEADDQKDEQQEKTRELTSPRQDLASAVNEDIRQLRSEQQLQQRQLQHIIELLESRNRTRSPPPRTSHQAHRKKKPAGAGPTGSTPRTDPSID